MKNNIKAKIKLASICASAIMTLSGCGSRHTNVIEDISENKILVRDITDGKQRIIKLGRETKSYTWDIVEYCHVGDTITVGAKGWYKIDRILVCNDSPSSQYGVWCDRDLLIRRKRQVYERQQQLQFDSLKSAMLREKQR